MVLDKTRKSLDFQSGTPHPFGATREGSWVNFTLFSSQAKTVTLGLFNEHNSKSPEKIFTLCPNTNRTGDVWHIAINNIPKNWSYAYQIQSAHETPQKWLLDPYAHSLRSPTKWGTWHEQVKDATHLENIKSYVPFPNQFDWQGITRPNIPREELMIYEMHVRGFTQDPSSKALCPGSYLGIIEKIPHLKSLGINTIELLPLFEFNECEYGQIHPETGTPLYNYWGYSSMSFFAPMRRFAHGEKVESPVLEFKEMVRELHRAGIAVILDVVFNHSSEKGTGGPIQSFKGIDEFIYYMLDSKGRHCNYSGCGNTLNCNHPVMRELIRDCLRYWYCEMQVDGFRFDLASILCRDSNGSVLAEPPLIEILAQDPLLTDCLLIAEPWDAGGLYQVGSFPSWGVWAEWNGMYRDEIRRFIKGSGGSVSGFTRVFCGSEDLYQQDRLPHHSINFITAHDGFSLRDLVSYNEKHNLHNAECNRDGCNHNDSWNCGEEGETDCLKTQELRSKQMRNLHLALVLSQGTPMFRMGDEYGHSCFGNNNPWCQDGPINWFQWDEKKQDLNFLRFVQLANQFRKDHPHFHRQQFLNDSDIAWHGSHGQIPNWDGDHGFIACTLYSPKGDDPLFIAFNPQGEETLVYLPEAPENLTWVQVANTGLDSPKDFLEKEEFFVLNSPTYLMSSYSTLLLKTQNISKTPYGDLISSN